jgi:hypothetical protein
VSPTTSQLYDQWRDGDATAGARLVESIQDWFDAVAMGRLGTERGALASSRAAERFRAGVGQLRSASELVGWGHGLVADEVAREGGRLRQPLAERGAEQLAAALGCLPETDRALLNAAYASEAGSLPDVPPAEVPLRLAAARDALKSALARDGARFTTAGVQPDHAPVAIYEAGRAGPDEETAIERWLLSDVHARRDVVEFSGWAAALRAAAPAPPRDAEDAGGPVAEPLPSGRDLALAPDAPHTPRTWPLGLGVCVAIAALVAWMLHG